MTTNRKDQFHHGDLRRALLDAARSLIEQDGVEGLSLRKVAARAGVSHAAPYHHFADKSALLATLAEEGFSQLEAATDEAADAAGHDPFDRLAAIGRTYIRYAIANPGYFELMFRPGLSRPDINPGVQQAGNSCFSRLTRTVDACLGEDVDPALRDNIVTSAWATVHGAASLWLDGPLERRARLNNMDHQALAEQVGRTFADLLRNSTAQRGSSVHRKPRLQR